MDLEFRGLRALANLALARYFGRAGAPGVLAALPVMLSLRAAVRAKVSAPAVAAQSDPALAERLRVQSLAYLAAAEGYLAPVPARLLAVGGLSGSGKSTLAGALAPGLGRAPGALHLRSDVLRKRLFGVAPEQPLPAESYTREVSARVYELLIDEARVALAAGQSVVADAVWSRPEERAAIAGVAGELGLAFTGLWLEAPREVLLARVGGRGADASDATGRVVADQADYELGEITWRRLDAAGDPRDVLAAARDEL
jgi:predicted kinase